MLNNHIAQELFRNRTSSKQAYTMQQGCNAVYLLTNVLSYAGDQEIGRFYFYSLLTKLTAYNYSGAKCSQYLYIVLKSAESYVLPKLCLALPTVSSFLNKGAQTMPSTAWKTSRNSLSNFA